MCGHTSDFSEWECSLSLLVTLLTDSLINRLKEHSHSDNLDHKVDLAKLDILIILTVLVILHT